MRRAILIVAFVAVGAGTAAAQDLEEPRPRQGYYVAGGAHAAAWHLRDDGERIDTRTGWAASLEFGELLTRRLGLGMRLDLGGASGGGRPSSTFGLAITGQVELAHQLSLHLAAGLGVVSVQPEDPDDPDAEIRGGYGAAYAAGLRYDWFPFPTAGPRRSGGLAVTPSLRLQAVPADPVSGYAVLLGVELTYWTGRPRDQLVLPPEEAFTR